MHDLDAIPNPEEDLKHAHMLLEQMSPEELLKATYALEEIIEASPWFIEKMNKLNQEAMASGSITSEELIDELGFKRQDFPELLETARARPQAA
jgi:hypothetical protein